MGFHSNFRFTYWTRAAMIAAIYALLTVIFAPISYGMIQVRISEMLMVLPFFTGAAVPGLFVGCLIANIFGGYGILDVVFGSLATLFSAYLVTKIKRRWLVPLPPVIVNALIVGAVLHRVLELPFFLTAVWVGAGQLVACYGLGFPLLMILEKRRDIFQ
ncbi:MAG TPA: QueT transporter family protein [Firmicutes bacterium]|nr:QueT transporter family protein [Bacillota bacterium]